MAENNGIPTAQEYISKQMPWAPDREDVAEALIEFAQLHVKELIRDMEKWGTETLSGCGCGEADELLAHAKLYDLNNIK